MRSDVNLIINYRSCNAKERINMIYMNYPTFEDIIKGYRQGLIYEITAQKSYNRKSNKGDLGVRVQVSGIHSDITADQAIENVLIGDALDTGNLSEDFYAGTDDRNELTRKVQIYWMMQNEYALFTAQLKTMDREDALIIRPYIIKEKSIGELAEDLHIEPESVRKKVYRIKKKLVAQIQPYFRENL